MDWHSESLVYADDANKNHPFECPICWTEVILAQGDINAAYFRHKDPSLSCPDYHPGIGTSSQWSSRNDQRFTLRLAHAGDTWTLYFKLPELRAKEMAVVTPRKLRGLTIALQHQDGVITQVNCLELWPGAGTSTVTVNPANQIRRAFTQGDWPPWDVQRWNNVVQDLPAMGATFGQDSGGDYVLCTASRPLFLGGSAVFVAQERVSPPSWVGADKLESHDGFAAWHFVAPPTADPRSLRWLTKLGTTIAETRSPSTILTPPIDYRNDGTHVIRADDSAIIEPSSSAAAIVAQSLEFQALKLGKPGEFVRLSGSFRDARLRTRSGDQMHVTKDDSTAPRRPFGHPELWEIVVGGRVYQPYTAAEIDAIRAPQLEVNTELPLRFTATVQYPGKTVARLSHANEEALHNWLERIDPSACSLEVDAGSFGIIRINSVQQSHHYVDVDDSIDSTRGTPGNESPDPDTLRAQKTSNNELNGSRWSSACMTLRADNSLPRPYWVLEGRRESTQYWRIQR